MTTTTISQRLIAQAKTKRERKANRKNPSRYARFNVTEEGAQVREDFNAQVAEARLDREQRRKAREAERQDELAALADEPLEQVTIHTPGIVSLGCDEGSKPCRTGDCSHDHSEPDLVDKIIERLDDDIVDLQDEPFQDGGNTGPQGSTDTQGETGA